MSRREFTAKVYAQIVNRAIGPDGRVVCEGCGYVLGKKPYHVDHTIPDALQIDKSRELTAADGKLLGVECCHKPKTKIDVGDIARAKRREAKHLGFEKRSRFAGSRTSGVKKKMDGRVVDRLTGEEVRR